MNEKAVEYTDVLNARLNKVQQDFDQQLVSIDRLATENAQKGAELKAKETRQISDISGFPFSSVLE